MVILFYVIKLVHHRFLGNVLKEQQPQRGLIIDSRGFQPAAAKGKQYIFQKSMKSHKICKVKGVKKLN
jgi:hypothetical protein